MPKKSTKGPIDLEKLKATVSSKYPIFGTLIDGTRYTIAQGDPRTAMTDGESVTFNANYMAGLTEGQQAFVLAHEIAHIAFMHIERGRGKDSEIWNYATDAVINQQLRLDGLPMPSGCVNVPEVEGRDVEEVYEMFMQQRYSKAGAVFGNLKRTLRADDHTQWEEIQKQMEKENLAKFAPVSETGLYRANDALRAVIRKREKTLKKLTKAAVDWQGQRERALKPDQITNQAVQAEPTEQSLER